MTCAVETGRAFEGIDGGGIPEGMLSAPDLQRFCTFATVS